LLVAGSVWGGDSSKGYLDTWRATVNGLETVAELHNHGLLCLDEISQCDPRTIGETAYMLANGIGKARMTRAGGTRRRLEWDLIFLSNGEQSLSDLAAQAGQRTRGGQEARMCDVEADAGKGMGLFEELNGMASPDALAQHLSAASRKYYGTAIREYLAQLVVHQEQIREAVRHVRDAFLKEHVPAEASGEVWRVAARFALVGAAGESAREITGWPQGTSLAAAAAMFKVWLTGRGTSGHRDDEAAIQQVRAFLEAHGASRFQDVTDTLARVSNRVGFKRTLPSGETEYLILSEAFRKEVCAGYDSRATAQVLAERGYLALGDGRNLAKRETVPELGRTRVYVVSARILDEP
jgi:putative DNA primase/helicase